MMITCTAAFMEVVVFLKLYIDEQFFNLITLQVDREKLHTSSIHQFIDNKHLGLTKYAVYLEKKNLIIQSIIPSPYSTVVNQVLQWKHNYSLALSV